MATQANVGVRMRRALDNLRLHGRVAPVIVGRRLHARFAACLGAAALIASLAPADAIANVAVRQSSIVEGQIFEYSPFAFEVGFSEPVQLVQAHLVDQDGQPTPVDLSAYRSRAANFVVELPVLLPHGYRLSWRVRSVNGVESRGSVGFVVKGCLEPRLADGRPNPAITPVTSSSPPRPR